MADLSENPQHSSSGSSSSSDLSVRVEHELGAGNGSTSKEVEDSGDAIANGSSVDKSTSSSSASVVLNGSNYSHWVKAMGGFLKGRKRWRYVTGDIKIPTKAATDTQEAYADKLEEWDSKNHQIITWFRNTSTPGIHLQFGRFENAKEEMLLLSGFLNWACAAMEAPIVELIYQQIHELRKMVRQFKVKVLDPRDRALKQL